MRLARKSSKTEFDGDDVADPVDRDELADADVPAAVVCAFCGEADCAGCRSDQTRSGVVAIVAWERRGAPALARLWATARASTFDADRFFELLPDGPIAPALRFALVSELIASASMAALVVVPAALVAPAWLRHVLLDQPVAAARLAFAAVPALAMILVLAHVAHGWALDRGARRRGARGATTRALRFGLYATGWDLVIGPFGAIVIVVKEGATRAFSMAGLGVTLPGKSARAFLKGCYRLEGAAAEPALRASYVAAAVATGVGAIATIAVLAAAVLL